MIRNRTEPQKLKRAIKTVAQNGLMQSDKSFLLYTVGWVDFRLFLHFQQKYP
jgi:hypothetical protein